MASAYIRIFEDGVKIASHGGNRSEIRRITNMTEQEKIEYFRIKERKGKITFSDMIVKN